MNKPWKTIRLLIKENPKYWMISILGAMLTSLPWFVSTWIVSQFLAKAIDLAVDLDWHPLSAFGMVLLALVFLRVPVIYGYRINSWAAEKLSACLQWHLLRSWNQRNPSKTSLSLNELLTRIVNDCAQNLSEFFFQGFGLKILEPILTGVSALIVLWVLQWKIALLSIGLGSCLSLITLRFSKTIETLHSALQAKNDQLNQMFTDEISNMETIKVMHMKSLKLGQFDECNKEIEKIMDRLAKTEIFLNVLPKLGELILIIITLHLSVSDLNFPVGNVVLVVSMQTFVNQLFSNFGTMHNEQIKTAIHGQRILSSIDQLNDAKRKEAKEPAFKGTIDTLKVEQIDLTYGKQRILNDVSLCAKQGDLTVIQGWTRPDRGKIFWNDQEQSKYELLKTRQKIRLFGQDPILFHGTIRENIELAASRSLSEEELKKLAALANWKDCEMNAMIEENGSNCSGGQRQKIAFMQALVSDVDVLLLDEPTSALDPESEEIFYKTLNVLKQEKIIVISTHRPFLIEKADSLYALKNRKCAKLKP